MKPFFFFIIVVLGAGLFVSCEEECLECQDPKYISGYSELEALSCDMLSQCAGAYLSESQCKANDYPESCHECVIAADTCSEVNSCYSSKCAGKEDSYNNSNNDDNNSTTDPSYEELCDVIRDDCGYDAISLSDCINDLMPRMGSTGRSCLDDAADNQDCLDVADWLASYAN